MIDSECMKKREEGRRWRIFSGKIGVYPCELEISLGVVSIAGVVVFLVRWRARRRAWRMVPRGPAIRKRLSPNSTTTVAAYIITGIHIYAWNTQESVEVERGEVGGGGRRRRRRRRRKRSRRGRQGRTKREQSEECAREDASRWLGWVSYYWINYPFVFIECSVFLFCFSLATLSTPSCALPPLSFLLLLFFFFLLLLLSWRCLPARASLRPDREESLPALHGQDCIEIPPEIHGAPWKYTASIPLLNNESFFIFFFFFSCILLFK